MRFEYRVAWRSKTTGVTGHGDWDEDLQLIKALVAKGNAEYPDIEHWVEKRP